MRPCRLSAGAFAPDRFDPVGGDPGLEAWTVVCFLEKRQAGGAYASIVFCATWRVVW